MKRRDLINLLEQMGCLLIRELLVETGRALCADPRRCEALLKDYCGMHKREINVLVSALKNRVADDLLKSSAGVPQGLVMARLQQRLEDDLALTAEAARWAVESWAYGLGIVGTAPVFVPVSARPAAVNPAKPVTEYEGTSRFPVTASMCQDWVLEVNH